MASNPSASATAVEDIAGLIRKLAGREPYRSATGPEALLKLAAHLEGLVGDDAGYRQNVVHVEVRKKKTG